MKSYILLASAVALFGLLLRPAPASAQAQVFFQGPDDACTTDIGCGVTNGNLFIVVTPKGQVLFRCQSRLPETCEPPPRAVRLPLTCDDMFDGELVITPSGQMQAICHGQL